jgi:quinol monooxygenase YgiN
MISALSRQALKPFLLVCVTLCLAFSGATATGQPMAPQHVQIAEIEIDPIQLDSYNAAVREQIETAIRVEPGVLVLYATAVKDNPAHVRVFEVYRDREAYLAHLQAPHFLKYKKTTEKMVKSLKLVPLTPVMLGAKPR